MGWSEVSLWPHGWTRSDNIVGHGESGYAEGVLRPDLLIVEGGRSQIVNPKRRDREAALIDLITSTLHSQHSVLLPVDPSPRLLELLVLLDQHWTFKLQPQPFQAVPADQAWPYPLCVVSRTAQDMVNFARSLIEWMGGVIRDIGEDEVMEEGRKGRKGRRPKRGGALGSEYGALDFRCDKFSNVKTCTEDSADEFNSSNPLPSSCKRTRLRDQNSFCQFHRPYRTVLHGGSLPPWQGQKAMSYSSQHGEKTIPSDETCMIAGSTDKMIVPNGAEDVWDTWRISKVHCS